MQISWQAQHFRTCRADFLAGADFPACVQISWQAQHFDGSSRSRCGTVRIGDRKANPLRTLGGSNRSRCGAVHILRSQPEPSARFRGAVRILRSQSERSASRRGAEHILRSRRRDETRDDRNASRVVARDMRKTTKDGMGDVTES